MKRFLGVASVVLGLAFPMASVAHEMPYSGGNGEGLKGCVGSPEVQYVPALGVNDLRDAATGARLSYSGLIACTPGAGGFLGSGGAFIPFGFGNSIEVVDRFQDVVNDRGHDVPFMVCIDNDGDRDCHPGPAGNPCPDDLFFSHDDGETYNNPLGPLPTSFDTGPGCAKEHPFDGYVVFLCYGTHGAGVGHHTHHLTTGTIRGSTGGTLGGGFANYCVPPVGGHVPPWVPPEPNQLPFDPAPFWPRDPSVPSYHVPPTPEMLRKAGLGGQKLIDCGIGNHPILNLSFVGICFGAKAADGWANGNHDKVDPIFGLPMGATHPQHITAAPTALLDISDQWFPTVPAFYCQDLNGDGICGGGVTDLGDPLETTNEPAVDFCDSITIRSGLTGPTPERLPRGSATDLPPGSFAGTWADPAATVFGNGESGNWAVDFDVKIFLASPTNGNAISGNACGPNPSAFGTQGWVSHT